MKNILQKSNLQRRIKRAGPIFIKGYFASKKNINELYFESYLELAALIHFEQDPTIVFIDTQPHTIEYSLELKKLTYTPDLMVCTVDGTRKYIEIKPKKKLKAERNSAKFCAVKAAYRKLDREFETFSEENVPEVRLENLELLYNGASACPADDSTISLVIQTISFPATVREVYNKIIEANLNSSYLHYLLFIQCLSIDLDVPITDDSKIELPVDREGVH